MIIKKFEEQVERFPDKIAVKDRNKNITYAELNHLANRTANEIIALDKTLKTPGNSNVSLLFEHGSDAIVAIIGALKAAKTYIPMDTGYPPKRLLYMLEYSESYAVLTNSRNYLLAETLVRQLERVIKLINIDNISGDISSRNIEREARGERPAYILYTSGSTGNPKGVVQNHENVLYFIEHWSRRFSINGSQRITLLSSLSHDAAIPDVFGALLNGAVLYPYDIKKQADMKELAEWLRKEKITIWHSVPTFYRFFTRILDEYQKFPDLQLIVLGGEEVRTHDIIVFKTAFPLSKFANIYGQTESTVNSIWLISPGDIISKVIIGEPIGETGILLVDENGGIIEEMGIGEIVITSKHIALGYWKDKENSKKVFKYSSEMGRLYWTGDIGQLMTDGSISIIGRKDYQLKIRGFRVEPGEIETELLAHPSVKETVVVAKKDENGDNYLCAYLVTKEPVSTKDLREFLAIRLPDYMIPGYFINIEKMPLTANGKIDRNALPEPAVGENQPVEYEVPTNETEKELIIIWQELTGKEKIGINTDFFDIGGHSLLVINMLSRIHKTFNVQLQLKEVFDNPRIKDLSRLIFVSKTTIFSSIEPVEEKEYYVTTPEQMRMYILNQFERIGVTYNVYGIMQIEGDVDRNRFQEAYRKLIRRHESLKTSFEMKNGKLIQLIHKDPVSQIVCIDVGKGNRRSENDIEEAIRNFIRPFDLSKAPLIRASLIRFTGDSYLLLLDSHHIIADGVSWDILIKELIRLYNEEELPALILRYKDYAEWQNCKKTSENLLKQGNYWQKEFAGNIPVLDLPTDYPRPVVQSFSGSSKSFEISQETAAALKTLILETGTTMFMMLLALYNVFLGRMCGQEDIVIGSPVAGRRHANLERIVGMFVNTLALINFPSGEKTFIDFLYEVKENTLKAFDNQDYRYDDLVDYVTVNRDITRNPLFDTMFVWQTIDTRVIDIPGVKLSSYKYESKTSKFDLTLIGLEVEDKLLFTFEYSTKLFTGATIERFITYFKKITSDVLINSKKDIKLSAIDIISTEEKRQLLFDFNDTGVEYPKDRTIHRLFEEQAEKTPDHTALVGPTEEVKKRRREEEKKEEEPFGGCGAPSLLESFGETTIPDDSVDFPGRPVQHVRPVRPVSLTYHELNEQSGRLAHRLIEQGVVLDTIVGIMVERSVEMVIGILAILKAGGAYLPIDPGYPQERIDFMLKDSGTKVLVTAVNLTQESEKLRRWEDKKGEGEKVRRWEGEKVLIEEILKYLKSSTYPLTFLPSHLQSPSNLAYIMYTSGSTGKPKGVLVEHRNVVNVVTWFGRTYGLSSYLHVLQISDYIFDASVNQIFGTLIHGAVLCIVNKDLQMDPMALHRFIQVHLIHVINFVPSFIHELLCGQRNEKLASLRSVISGAEKLDDTVKDRILKKGYRLYNQYGPTETTIDALAAECSWEKVNLGKPIANVKCYILDRYNNLLPVGIAGELLIAGAGVSRGYLNNPELTFEKFCLRRPRTFLKKGSWTSKDLLLNHSPLTTHHSPHYRTGDLAKWLPDGNIEFRGRIDHQVKIRGFRIELGEIENRLLTHGEIKEAVVLEKTDESGNSCLSAYFVSKREIPVSELREYLLKQLPEYMIPAYFTRLGKIPVTLAGKIDRKALPAPEALAGVGYVAPRTQVEEKLAVIWAGVLGRESSPGIDDNFFQLGGHSLKATILISRIHKELNAKIPLAEVFKTPTIRGLSRFIASTGIDKYAAIEPVEEKEYYPLSPVQKRLFFLQQLVSDNISYNMPYIIPLGKSVEKEKLESIFKRLIERHESLRTSFITLNEKPVQRIHRDFDFSIGGYEVAEEAGADSPITGFIKPFNLDTAPLLRVNLITVGSSHRILFIDMHHIITDGTSEGILKKEFLALQEEEELPPLRLQYKDYSEWNNIVLQQEAISQQESYWINEYSDEIPVLNLPTDYQRPLMRSFEGKSVNFEIEEEEAQALKTMVLSKGSTGFMGLMAIYSILLSKLSGHEDIVIGTPIAGRRHADLEKIIGMFVNTLSLRNYPKGGQRFRDFLGDVKERTLMAFENQEYPFEELVEKLSVKRDIGRNPIFDIMFVLQNMNTGLEGQEKELEIGASQPVQPGIPKKYENIFQAAKFDLTLTAVERSRGLFLSFRYCTQLFNKETIERFIDYFKKIVTTVVSEPGIRLREIEIISEEEKKQILFDFNETRKEYPKNKTIHQLFEEQMQRTPDFIAVAGSSISLYFNQLTYRELNENSNRLYHELEIKGVRPDTIIGIMVEHSVERIVGIMGILKSGGAYLPIDPEYPKVRIDYMLKDSGTKFLVSTCNLAKKGEKVGGWEDNKNLEIVLLNNLSSPTFKNSHLPNFPTSQLPNFPFFPATGQRPPETSLAYIIYTSGTAGKPKGVLVEHRNAVNTVSWFVDTYNVGRDIRVLQITNYTFDPSVNQIFGTLISGASLYTTTKEMLADIGKLRDYMTYQRINIINFASVFLKELLGDLEKLESLHAVLSGTERLDDTTKEAIMAKGYRLFNLYGPTETTIDALALECSRERVSLGKPISNVKVYILNKYEKVLPIGVVGELYITGAGVARGYLNRPELTAEKFLRTVIRHSSFVIGSSKSSLKTNDQCPMTNDQTKNFSPNDRCPMTNDRLYRTGDLVRWLKDGNIEFIGRGDLQVKIRGYRIEPAEIESQLLKCHDICESVVIVRENREGKKYLCAYFVSKKKMDISELRTTLLNTLPDYMIPSYFIQVERIPLTATGKIDRKALNSIVIEMKSKEEYVAPRNEIEKKIVEIWKEVLSLEKVGVSENFFDLGGTSLDLIRLNTKIKATFNEEDTVVEMFRYSTIRSFAEFLIRKRGGIVSNNSIHRSVPINKIKQTRQNQKSKKMKGGISNA